MLMAAEVGVAARGSVPVVASFCDESLSQPGGAGVSLYVHKLLEHGGIMPTPNRRAVVLGKKSGGQLVTIPNSGTNIVISGDPRSGKSWIAGLLAEQFVEEGYRICVVDPEGDFAQMGQRPKVLTLGHEIALLSPPAAAKLLSHEELSLILTLSSLTPREQLNYVDQLLAALQETRQKMGCPHWVVIDEAHYFFQAHSAISKYLSTPTGNFCLVTYRPSLLASEVYGAIGAYIITSTKVEEERYFITKILQAHNHLRMPVSDALNCLELPRAGVLMVNSLKNPWQVFTPIERLTVHAHHARKYSDTRLSDDKGVSLCKCR